MDEILNKIENARRKNLTALSFNENQLIELPPEIGQLTNLIELNLNKNQLIALPPEIGQLTKLLRLDSYGNQLTKLPAEIGQLTKLIELDLHGNQLIELPPEIGQLTNLSYLDLHGNQLTKLPAEIGQFTKLIELNLHGNQLTELIPEIGQLTNLIELNLDENQLIELPPEIGQLTNLIELYLLRNHLAELPPEIGQLTKLLRLDLHGNQLTKLPAEIGQLTKLIALNLHGNHLIDPPQKLANTGKDAVFNYFKQRESEKREERIKKKFKIDKKSIISLYMPHDYGPNQVGQMLYLISSLYEGLRIILSDPIDERDPETSLKEMLKKGLAPEHHDTFRQESSLRFKTVSYNSFGDELLGLTAFTTAIWTIAGLWFKRIQIEMESEKFRHKKKMDEKNHKNQTIEGNADAMNKMIAVAKEKIVPESTRTKLINSIESLAKQTEAIADTRINVGVGLYGYINDKASVYTNDARVKVLTEGKSIFRNKG